MSMKNLVSINSEKLFMYIEKTYWKRQGFPHTSVGKSPVCNTGDWGLILGQEDPLENKMATHSSILA